MRDRERERCRDRGVHGVAALLSCLHEDLVNTRIVRFAFRGQAIMKPMAALQHGNSIGRISRLVDSQQIGTITGDDGKEYVFSGSSLRGITFGQLSLGTAVSFSPMTVGKVLRAEQVAPKDAR
jgi:hypothetical protein